MPAWLHNRADHIRRKNPSMPKSEAFAIATQQSHASGHTPKGYGTAEGKREANKKYDKPASEYEQTADPKSKSSSVNVTMLQGFADELSKIAGLKKRQDMPYQKPKPEHETLPPPLASDAG